MSRRAVGAAVASVCSLAASGCSIDFVPVEERPIATFIDVRSEHVDGLRVIVEIRHSGPVVASVWIDGERIAVEGPDGTGNYTVHFEPLVDPLTPVLDIGVEQLPGTQLAVQAPLLVRTGQASCEADGDVWLPVRLDPIAGDGLSRSWTVTLFDGDGGISTVAQTAGSLPDPLVVPGELMTEFIRRARISVRVVGPVEEAPHDTHLDLRTAAEWSIPDLCPSALTAPHNARAREHTAAPDRPPVAGTAIRPTTSSSPSRGSAKLGRARTAALRVRAPLGTARQRLQHGRRGLELRERLSKRVSPRTTH